MNLNFWSTALRVSSLFIMAYRYIDINNDIDILQKKKC